MAILLNTDARSGPLTLDNIDPAADRDELVITLPIDRADLGSRDVALRMQIEQSPDGSLWWPIGGTTVRNVLTALDGDKSGPVNALTWRFREQLYRADAYFDLGFDRWGGATYELRNMDDGAHYFKLAMNRRLRLTVDAYVARADGSRQRDARLVYGCDATFAKGSQPGTPAGQRSASLLGVFTVGEGAGAVTTGSRTTTSGSLITGTPGAWKSSGAMDHDACTDSFTNEYTRPTTYQTPDYAVGTDTQCAGLSYNIGGTRGASHTVSHVDEGNNTLGAQEWDGVAASPTVVSASGSGNGTAISGTVTVAAASLVILVAGYASTSTTFSASGGASEAQEIDENNDRCAIAVYYKVAQTGSPTVEATLAAARDYGWLCVSFTESGAATVMPPRSSVVSDAVHRSFSW